MAGSSKRSWKLGAAAVCGVASMATALTLNPLTVTSAGASGLTEFADCEDLRDSYASAAMSQVTAWGWQLPYSYGTDVMMRMDAVTPTVGALSGEQGDAVGNGPTGTNILEPGVDEPDLAKTNGDVTVVVDDHRLRIYEIHTGVPQEVAVLALDKATKSNEILLIDDRVIVFGSAADSVITTVDIGDPGSPIVLDEKVVEGQLITSREVDGVVRVVISHRPHLDLVHPTDTRSPREAMAENRRIVQSMPAEAWLPSVTQSEEEQPIVACGDVLHPATGDRALATLVVLTFDPNQPTEASSIAVKAAGDMVHATTDRLYVAAGGWQGGGWAVTDMPIPDQGSSQVHTELYAFATEGETTQYVASGQVPGTVPGRWALSGYQGDLRVASQQGDWWSPSETVVTILAEEGGALTLQGSVGGMGEGEQLKSVRWLGHLAVLVTFRQTDPLYTLDLSRATDPEVMGELKIPGFSTYLHPVGDDVILGAGQDASWRGMTRGAQVSLFDVADLARPDRIATLGLGSDTSSPLDSDPRSFTYLPDLGIAFVPVSHHRGGTRIQVIEVQTDGTLRLMASYRVGASPQTARAMPLDGEHVALVAGGQIVEVLAVTGSGDLTRIWAE